MIQLNIIGFVGQNAKYTANDKGGLISFNVCSTEKFKNKDGNLIEVSQWVNCYYYVRDDKQTSYIKQGDLIFVQGKATFASSDQKTKIFLTVEKINYLNTKK